VLTASSDALLHCVINLLHHEFAMKELGDLHHLLGLSVSHNHDGLFLCRRRYTLDILARAGKVDCKPCATPIDMSAKLSSDGPPVENTTDYRGLACALQYLTFTRPDISYVVRQVCLFMHDPWEPHLTLVKRILRYLKGTIDNGLQLHRSTVTSLVAYSDAD
jgi:hypothetical protein